MSASKNQAQSPSGKEAARATSSFWGCVLGFDKWGDYFSERGVVVPQGLVLRWGNDPPPNPAPYCTCSTTSISSAQSSSSTQSFSSTPSSASSSGYEESITISIGTPAKEPRPSSPPVKKSKRQSEDDESSPDNEHHDQAKEDQLEEDQPKEDKAKAGKPPKQATAPKRKSKANRKPKQGPKSGKEVKVNMMSQMTNQTFPREGLGSQTPNYDNLESRPYAYDDRRGRISSWSPQTSAQTRNGEYDYTPDGKRQLSYEDNKVPKERMRYAQMLKMQPADLPDQGTIAKTKSKRRKEHTYLPDTNSVEMVVLNLDSADDKTTQVFSCGTAAGPNPPSACPNSGQRHVTYQQPSSSQSGRGCPNSGRNAAGPEPSEQYTMMDPSTGNKYLLIKIASGSKKKTDDISVVLNEPQARDQRQEEDYSPERKHKKHRKQTETTDSETESQGGRARRDSNSSSSEDGGGRRKKEPRKSSRTGQSTTNSGENSFPIVITKYKTKSRRNEHEKRREDRRRTSDDDSDDGTEGGKGRHSRDNKKRKKESSEPEDDNKTSRDEREHSRSKHSHKHKHDRTKRSSRSGSRSKNEKSKPEKRGACSHCGDAGGNPPPRVRHYNASDRSSRGGGKGGSRQRGESGSRSRGARQCPATCNQELYPPAPGSDKNKDKTTDSEQSADDQNESSEENQMDKKNTKSDNKKTKSSEKSAKESAKEGKKKTNMGKNRQKSSSQSKDSPSDTSQSSSNSTREKRNANTDSNMSENQEPMSDERTKMADDKSIGKKGKKKKEKGKVVTIIDEEQQQASASKDKEVNGSGSSTDIPEEEGNGKNKRKPKDKKAPKEKGGKMMPSDTTTISSQVQTSETHSFENNDAMTGKPETDESVQNANGVSGTKKVKKKKAPEKQPSSSSTASFPGQQNEHANKSNSDTSQTSLNEPLKQTGEIRGKKVEKASDKDKSGAQNLALVGSGTKKGQTPQSDQDKMFVLEPTVTFVNGKYIMKFTSCSCGIATTQSIVLPIPPIENRVESAAAPTNVNRKCSATIKKNEQEEEDCKETCIPIVIKCSKELQDNKGQEADGDVMKPAPKQRNRCHSTKQNCKRIPPETTPSEPLKEAQPNKETETKKEKDVKEEKKEEKKKIEKKETKETKEEEKKKDNNEKKEKKEKKEKRKESEKKQRRRSFAEIGSSVKMLPSLSVQLDPNINAKAFARSSSEHIASNYLSSQRTSSPCSSITRGITPSSSAPETSQPTLTLPFKKKSFVSKENSPGLWKAAVTPGSIDLKDDSRLETNSMGADVFSSSNMSSSKIQINPKSEVSLSDTNTSVIRKAVDESNKNIHKRKRSGSYSDIPTQGTVPRTNKENEKLESLLMAVWGTTPPPSRTENVPKKSYSKLREVRGVIESIENERKISMNFNRDNRKRMEEKNEINDKPTHVMNPDNIIQEKPVNNKDCLHPKIEISNEDDVLRSTGMDNIGNSRDVNLQSTTQSVEITKQQSTPKVYIVNDWKSGFLTSPDHPNVMRVESASSLITARVTGLQDSVHKRKSTMKHVAKHRPLSESTAGSMCSDGSRGCYFSDSSSSLRGSFFSDVTGATLQSHTGYLGTNPADQKSEHSTSEFDQTMWPAVTMQKTIPASTPLDDESPFSRRREKRRGKTARSDNQDDKWHGRLGQVSNGSTHFNRSHEGGTDLIRKMQLHAKPCDDLPGIFDTKEGIYPRNLGSDSQMQSPIGGLKIKYHQHDFTDTTTSSNEEARETESSNDKLATSAFKTRPFSFSLYNNLEKSSGFLEWEKERGNESNDTEKKISETQMSWKARKKDPKWNLLSIFRKHRSKSSLTEPKN